LVRLESLARPELLDRLEHRVPKEMLEPREPTVLLEQPDSRVRRAQRVNPAK
jgi:hypothetical protein